MEFFNKVKILYGLAKNSLRIWWKVSKYVGRMDTANVSEIRLDANLLITEKGAHPNEQTTTL